ncbi:MAG TPA: FAD-dependent oxidoreductase [Tepidisphaeraceae bacterium]|jgi:NADPH-dependent 2,4-dienoyl-CoA reductase/sulfur reductase-like enzyme/rhodanese-related sulfurtransferase
MKSLRIVIIGGVAGGMSAATRARRLNEHASIIVLERGGHISFANCGLPYYLAGRIASEEQLLIATPANVRRRFNIDARVGHEVTQIDRAGKSLEVLDHAGGRSYRLGYDKLIVATGASPIIPPIDHVHAPNVFFLRSMEDTRQVQRWLVERKPTSVAIIGAGFIGLEMAEAMRQRGLAVTVIEKAPQVLPPLDAEMASPVAEELRANHIEVITGNGLKALHATGECVSAVETEDGQRIETGMVLLSIGVRPNVTLAAEAGIKLGDSGAVAVDEYQRTSDADIYAVGDASEVLHGVTNAAARIPLAGPANRQGRLAGEHAATGASAARGKPLGTAIVQVFGLAVGMSGLNEAAARRAGIDCDSAYVLPNHHAGYYPGAQPMRIKLLYRRGDGRILGAQIVGHEGVDKRIDVIAAAMHFNGTIDDLAQLDLAYAPQFGSAKDAVHLAAMVAQNQRSQAGSAVAIAEVGDDLLVDVRTAGEFAAGSLPGAISIPLDELRGRIGELDRARAIVVFCQVGQRGYVAQRILRQNGFADVRNLKGGISLAMQCAAKLAQPIG